MSWTRCCFKYKQEVQICAVTRHFFAFRSCCQDNRIHCFGLLSHAERSIRCLGTCRVIDMGTQILTTKVIPTHDADTLGYLFGELVESCECVLLR